MTIIVRVFSAVMFLAAGFAAGFPLGQHKGFSRGSEWALVQADIVARESGVFMPVRFQEDEFHVIFKQPKGIYTRTRRLADRQDNTRTPKAFELRIEPATGDLKQPERVARSLSCAVRGEECSDRRYEFVF